METTANYSPYGSTPGDPYEYYYDEKNFPSPSPTPSPRGFSYYFNPSPPVRPATRAHFRGQSTSGFNNPYLSPQGPSFSPRYTSDGQYATANASQSNYDANLRQQLIIITMSRAAPISTERPAASQPHDTSQSASYRHRRTHVAAQARSLNARKQLGQPARTSTSVLRPSLKDRRPRLMLSDTESLWDTL